MGASLSVEDVDSAATEWVARLDGRPLTGAEQTEFDQWISSDTRHHGAFVRASAALSMLDCMQTAQGAPERRREIPRAPITRRSLWVGGGAAIAASVVGGAWFLHEGGRYQTFTTQEGEIRRLTFPGGAELILDARSKVRAVVSRGLRMVSLDAGRAWFDMRQGSAYPLTVHAGDLRLQTSRASFSAARMAEKVDLTVAEGTVEAWNSQGAEASRLTFQGGSQATLIKAALVEQSHLSPLQLARAEAWKTGHLALDGESVAEAAAIFNRHNHLQLVIRSESVARQSLVGYFDISDPIGFAAALEASFKVRGRRVGDQIFLE